MDEVFEPQQGHPFLHQDDDNLDLFGEELIQEADEVRFNDFFNFPNEDNVQEEAVMVPANDELNLPEEEFVHQEEAGVDSDDDLNLPAEDFNQDESTVVDADDELNLPEEEFVHQEEAGVDSDDDLNLPAEDSIQDESTVVDADDELMLSDNDLDESDESDESDKSNESNEGNAAQCYNNPMLPEVIPDAQRDNSAYYNNFQLNIPQYLPERALVTNTMRYVHANGHQEHFLTIHNTPINNYAAPKINDGYEFAVGGDPSHILTTLHREFALQPQQNFHVVVITERNLQLCGVPRRFYPMFPAMPGGNFQNMGQGDGSQQYINFGDGLMNGGPANPAYQDLAFQGFDFQADLGFNAPAMPQQNIAEEAVMCAGPGHCPDPGHGHPPAPIGPGQPQQNTAVNDLMFDGAQDVSAHSYGDQVPPVQPDYDFLQAPPMPLQNTPTPHHSSEQPTSSEHSKRKRSARVLEKHRKQEEEKEKKQKEEDAATIEADDRFESFAGTNLCRWCGRRGHEAVDCIKWDPEHFDKAVCVVCNNKKHIIDECLRWDAIDYREKTKLVLVDGANKPGVRSFFWPWSHFGHEFLKDPERDIFHKVTAFPMSRAFAKRLSSSEPNGDMWANLWKTFPYGECQVPKEFVDKGLVLENQDECFEGFWPSIMEEGDMALA